MKGYFFSLPGRGAGESEKEFFSGSKYFSQKGKKLKETCEEHIQFSLKRM